MKILELRFKNLNSLYGEWIIDFTSPEYTSNGFFALTGPTGAGKSTILDAICLALYGATPRLGKIQGKENEIISRQTGECYSEVLFESQTGQFRCHWEQRKARKKSDGKLQPSEHQITDAYTGKPIETKKSLVSGIIEKKTGMDFDRFTRSILLAQGGFDTFLKADIEQKSRILEQITGTKIYSEISRRVFERKKTEEEQLNLLKAEISGIIILNSEDEKEIKNKLGLNRTKEKELEAELINTDKAINWLNSINNLKKEISVLTDEQQKLQVKIESFKPEQFKLNQAVKAASLDAEYATLLALRKQQFEDQTTLKAEIDSLPILENSIKLQADALRNDELQTKKAKDNLKTAAPIIQKIRLIDQMIDEQAKSISEFKKNCLKEAEIIKLNRQNLQKECEHKTKAKKILKNVDKYLKDNAQNEWLISGLTGLEEQFGNLVDKQKVITQKESKLKSANTSLKKLIKDLDKAKMQCLKQKLALDKTTKNLIQAKDTLNKLLGDKLLREYHAEKESLQKEKGYLEKIAALEDHRTQLQDGKPCPLCGSTDHPFAKGNIPEASKIDLRIEQLNNMITKAENQEDTIKKFEVSESSAKQQLNESQKLETNVSNERKLAENKIEDLKEEVNQLKIDFETLKLAVLQKLQPLGIIEIPDSKASLLLESLKTRLKEWQKQASQKNKSDKQISNIEANINRLKAIIETQDKTLKENHEKLKQLIIEFNVKNEERKNLYGDKNTDIEENRLNKAISIAEEAEKKSSKIYIQFNQKLTAVKTHIESLTKRINHRKPEISKTEADLYKSMILKCFNNEKHFLECRLSSEQREKLSLRAKELENAQTDLMARYRDRHNRMLVETEKKITEKTLEDLVPQFKKLDTTLKELREVSSALKHKLSENSLAKERIKDKQFKINAQEKEFDRWEILNKYIGSADGKKYRNFAQGLTFELMVSHANQQLNKMTDRYLLLRDKKEPLELNVIDDYQAGEIRSTKNLSGGESFIVSLALALGLSKMASRKVRVDSLFLDEGFATLDDNALDIALNALSGLQQSGKVIGMISHVSALKERISTQIAITPLSNGRSSLTGPGCKKLH